MRFVVLILAALLTIPLAADAVRLSSGQVVEGKIIAESEEYLIIRTRLGPVRLAKSDILEIERKSGDKRIIRTPNPRPDPLWSFVYSFIPFYSGFYQGDQPAAGVPFAAANGYYAATLLKLFAGARSYTDWASRKRQEEIVILMTARSEFVRQTDASYHPATEFGSLYFHFIQSLILPDIYRFSPVSSVKVGKDIYTKREIADYRRRTFYRYLGASMIGGALSLLYARWSNKQLGGGAGRELEFAGLVLEPAPVERAGQPEATRVGVRFSF